VTPQLTQFLVVVYPEKPCQISHNRVYEPGLIEAIRPLLHFHMLFLDGVYVEGGQRKLRFHRVKATNVQEIKALVHVISHRVSRI
jgi:hypothetical protein